MLKKSGILSLVIIFIFSFAAECYCLDSSEIQNLRIHKLGRGISNIFTCPLEMIKQPADAGKDDGFIAGITVGIIRGVVMTVVRLAAGALETVTFFAPFPDKEYKPLLTDPEFFMSQDPYTV